MLPNYIFSVHITPAVLFLAHGLNDIYERAWFPFNRNTDLANMAFRTLLADARTA